MESERNRRGRANAAGGHDDGSSRNEPLGLIHTRHWPDADMWVCNCVVVRSGKLLLLQRDRDGFLGGYWDLPGGKRDPGEQPAVTAARELYEEAGLHAAQVSEIAHYSNPDMGGEDFRFHTVTFHATESNPEAPVQLSGEHPDYRWVTPAQCADMEVVWYVRRVLAHLDWGTMDSYHGELD